MVEAACCLPAGSNTSATASKKLAPQPVDEVPYNWSPLITFPVSAADSVAIKADSRTRGIKIINNSSLSILYVNTGVSAENGSGYPIQPGGGIDLTGKDCWTNDIHLALAPGAPASTAKIQIGKAQ